MCQAKACASQEFHADLPQGWQQSSYSSHSLLPPMMRISRKLEPTAEPGLEPRHPACGWSHPKLCYNLLDQYSHPSFAFSMLLFLPAGITSAYICIFSFTGGYLCFHFFFANLFHSKRYFISIDFVSP